ncbi:MBL fold metallo-hydrolase [Agromyces atrinae]|uniref:MBL fold metallo-hydrolase n=1 Tax=Agromyces atrinae TaxID=592376 RepID=A0A4V1R290_9MICO|nr:MBL fold metallo-hydrolase [Agromyces atrinae]
MRRGRCRSGRARSRYRAVPPAPETPRAAVRLQPRGRSCRGSGGYRRWLSWIDGNRVQLSSLSHLTAVSGANCAIVVAAVMLLGAAARVPRGVRIALAAVALLGFVVLVTPEASVVRAGVMALIVLVSLARGRQGGGLPALALAVVVLLVLDPWMSRDYGFALSVLATAGLLVLTSPLSRALERWMPSSLARVLAIPLAAQLACQPVLILLEPSLPLYGVAANLLAAPAAPVGTVLGLVACLVLPVLPGVAYAAAQIAWAPASWIAAIAHTAAALPGARVPWMDGLVGFLVIVIVTLAALGVALAGRRRVLVRGVAIAIVVVAVGSYVGAALVTPRLRTASLPADWSMAACDIGQGDAVVVRSGDVHVLVDSGPDPEALSRCLDQLGIDRLDVFVISHFDLDHIGGTDAIVGRVDAVVTGGVPDPRGSDLLAQLADGGAEIHEVVAGDHGRIGGVWWSVLWPDAKDPAAEAGNDASVSMVMDAEGVRSLFLGDLGEDSQRALLATSAVPDVDVVKVAHHGSADQLAEVYQDARAEVGIISVGADNGYGHPAESILQTLSDTGAHALRTDQLGLIVLARSDDGLSAWFERSPPGGDAFG